MRPEFLKVTESKLNYIDMLVTDLLYINDDFSARLSWQILLC